MIILFNEARALCLMMINSHNNNYACVLFNSLSSFFVSKKITKNNFFDNKRNGKICTARKNEKEEISFQCLQLLSLSL